MSFLASNRWFFTKFSNIPASQQGNQKNDKGNFVAHLAYGSDSNIFHNTNSMEAPVTIHNRIVATTMAIIQFAESNIETLPLTTAYTRPETTPASVSGEVIYVCPK